MSGDGLRVALILPNEQIKFVSVACPDDADPITINEHILRTMDGATPYPMDELRFDHHLADGTLYVAAVALETLNEAEEFAKNYGFSPLACIARTDTFPTEVFFGLSDAPLGLMPRLSTEEPEDDVEESAPPVIAFARRDTPEDTQSSPQPRPFLLRHVSALRPNLSRQRRSRLQQPMTRSSQNKASWAQKLRHGLPKTMRGNPGAHLRFCCC